MVQDYVLIDGQRCEHWVADEGSSRVHIWFSVLPFRGDLQVKSVITVVV